MYVYIQKEQMFEIGFYDPLGKWNKESTCISKNVAAAHVSYLNGGISPQFEAEQTKFMETSTEFQKTVINS